MAISVDSISYERMHIRMRLSACSVILIAINAICAGSWLISSYNPEYIKLFKTPMIVSRKRRLASYIIDIITMLLAIKLATYT